MDTSTHITMGFGLAGLAYIDPSIAASPELASAVLLGTVIGSNAPDFDFVYKVKGNSAYFRHHRGLSHSLPALPLWALALSSIIWMFHQNVSFFHLFIWTFLAVILHVLFDIFNVYGTQAGRPISKEWLALNCIPLFDPFITGSHIVGFILWYNGFHPGICFLLIYGLISIYLLERYFSMKRTLNFISLHSGKIGQIKLIPSMSWINWGFIIENDTHYYVGSLKNKRIELKHTFQKLVEDTDILKKARQDENVQNFLSSTNYAHPLVITKPHGYEVRWFDLRFRSKNHYPLMAVVQLNKDLIIQSSFTGWFHQTDQIEKKLSLQKSM
ncbi:metal-dependent hydrolase [Bacillus sp. DJP31]|uniref:metal-dependent hydrolase n=1 Tax=Bacillus sp. DJP31 TaxID=3409789 RepID=UPI003BB686DA